MSEISTLADNSKDRILSVDADMESEFEEESPETDETYEMALWVVIHAQPTDLVLDPDLAGVEAERATARGVLEASFGGDSGRLWSVQVNWDKSQWAGLMPPGYARISYAEQEVAIMGPWLTCRTCWKCGLKGLRGRNVGVVLPGVECPGCGTLDWFGHFVSPEMFIRDGAEYIADETGESDKTYRKMAGKYA